MDNLTTEELRLIALEKNKRGVATVKAKKAQKILWDRANNPYSTVHYGTNHKKRTSSDYSYLS